VIEQNVAGLQVREWDFCHASSRVSEPLKALAGDALDDIRSALGKLRDDAGNEALDASDEAGKTAQLRMQPMLIPCAVTAPAAASASWLVVASPATCVRLIVTR
jgi:hypothetical protein